VAKAWEVETARLDERVKALKEATDVSKAVAKEAVLKAEEATTIHFESVNEFRGTLTDQASKFITRSELIAAMLLVVAIITVVNKLIP